MFANSWTRSFAHPLAGFLLAPESQCAFAWDRAGWLTLLDARGEVQTCVQRPHPIVLAALAVDHSLIVTVDAQAQLTLLDAELRVRWQRPADRRVTALACDPLGRGFALADAYSSLEFFDAQGYRIREPISTPRPIVHLQALPAEPAFAAAADFGFLGVFDLSLNAWTWSDKPVVHVGGLAAGSEGPALLAGCFSEGIRAYSSRGEWLGLLPTPQPSRSIARSYSGQVMLSASVDGSVHALDAQGAVLEEWTFPPPVVGIGLSPLGDSVTIATSDRRIARFARTAPLKMDRE